MRAESDTRLATWYKNLQKAASINKRLDENLARDKYCEALKTPKLKYLYAWADRWEQAMTEAQDKEVPAAMRISDWFEDFLAAVKGVNPTWAESYHISRLWFPAKIQKSNQQGSYNFAMWPSVMISPAILSLLDNSTRGVYGGIICNHLRQIDFSVLENHCYQFVLEHIPVDLSRAAFLTR